MAKNSINENKNYLIIVLIVFVVAIVGITYAWFVQRSAGSDNKINLKAATELELELNNEDATISIDTAVPMSDTQGLALTPYTFDVVNRSTSVNASYNLFLENVELDSGKTRIADSDIKYSLTRNSGNEGTALLSALTDRKFNTNPYIINANTTDSYTLKLWINSEATKENVAGKQFKAKIRVEATQTESSVPAQQP